MVERGPELSALARELGLAGRGKGRLLAIEGPPGIGKTSLLNELAALARAREMVVLSARSGESESGFAYGVVRQLLERVARSHHLAQELLTGHAAAVRWLLEEPVGAIEDERTYDILHGLLWLVINDSAHHPLVLAVDDAQWADTPSLRFLAYLARRLDGLRVLVALAYRATADSAPHQVEEVLLAAADRTVLRPRPLTAAGTASILRDTLGEAADVPFASACQRLSGGRPLLVHELVRALDAERIRPTADNVEALARIGPSAVARTVRVRIAQASTLARRLAEAVAILGDRGPLAVASELAGLDDDATGAALEELRRLEILHAGPAPEFVHPAIREAVRESLDPPAAARAHGEAARLLARAGAPDSTVAAHLVHARPAGEVARVETLRRAASEAMSARDTAVAAQYLRRALDEQPPRPLRTAVLLELATALEAVDGGAALACLEEAVGGIDDPQLRAATLARIAARHPSARPDQAIRIALEAIDQLGEADVALRRLLLAIVGSAAAASHSPLVGIPAELDASIRQEMRAGGAGSGRLACVVAYQDAWRGAPAAAAASSAERGFSGDPHPEMREFSGAHMIGMIVLLAADSPAAPSAIESWFGLARAEGSLIQLAGAGLLHAHECLLAGRLVDAAAAGEDASEAMSAYGVRGAVAGYLASVQADVAIEQGRLADAAAAIEHARCNDQEAGAVGLHTLRLSRARLRAAQGDPAGALDDLLTLGRRFEELGGAGCGLLAWRSHAALLAHATGRDDEARRLAAAEVELARTWGTPRAIGRALTAAGAVEEKRRAVALLHDAVAALEHADAPLEQARALVHLARALGREHGSSRAREPLRRALELAAACGAHPLKERIRDDLIAAGARPRRSAVTGSRALTRSELRVARLAAAGASNREIAEELHVTPRTVETHLSNAYRKLEIRSRAQLAAALDEPAPGTRPSAPTRADAK